MTLAPTADSVRHPFPVSPAPARGDAHRLRCRRTSRCTVFTCWSPGWTLMEEDKAARFTILIDAERKKAFDDLCASKDVTSSQMIRQLIRQYLDQHGVRVDAGSMR